jgi:putative DNA primase/helicase
MRGSGITTREKLIPDGKLHRFHIEGHKPKSKNGWFVFHSDEPQSGAFGDYKTGVNDTWTGKTVARMTDAEREVLRVRMEKAKQERAAELEKSHAMCRQAAADIMAATEPASESHPYLIKKGIKPLPSFRQLARDVRYSANDEERPTRTARKGWLVVPIYGPDKTLHSVQTIAGDGTKYYLHGTNKAGHYWSIGALTETIVIGEGLATLATVHAATQFCCVVAFDSGNLMSVAKAIRQKFPNRKIIIACDNDRFTAKPMNNPGVHYGKAAAEAVGGEAVWPDFPDGAEGTDFNDLAVDHGGIEAVRGVFFPAPPAPPDEPQQPLENEGPPVGEDHDERPSETPPDLATAIAAKNPVWHLALGFESGPVYYFRSERTGLIEAWTPAQIGKSSMMSIAPLQFWEMEFPSKTGPDWTAAQNALIGACQARGYYEPELITGRGVVLDKDRVVLHLGDKLIVDGKAAPSLVLDDSELIYERGRRVRLPACKPLRDDEGMELLECLELLPWTTSDMAVIFAGWLVVAPICGVLPWRPHLWLTGPAGSGKSYIIKTVAARILHKLCISVQGSTSEAAIRQSLGRDALPVIFDEAESQNDRARERLQLIIDLARQSSSEDGGEIVKGGQNGKAIRYKIQSTFLFSSINLGAYQSADLSRTLTLSLEGPEPEISDDGKQERREKFDYIQNRFAKLLQNNFGARLFGRTLMQAKTIRANADTFAAVIAEGTGNQRISDTLSAPLAGWFALKSRELLTREKAREILVGANWALQVAERNRAEADHDQAISHVLEQKIMVSPTRVENVASLIYAASARSPTHDDPLDDAAYRALLNIGIRVIPGSTSNGCGDVLFGSSHAELARLFNRTAWQNSWSSALAQHPRCTRVGVKRFGAITKKALSFNIPELGIGVDKTQTT